ncbi:hypothetical protein SAMN05444359_102197 [Neolewinella agarilytica]|uniref:Uncharacterized protein n=1 Tax=Neolewinella agarilytica TaxID=478744 RepID=A0A1H9AQW9_9BACT|nr:hypothetical protein SAMN05444359_102197 [Neolewinella agarilytica]
MEDQAGTERILFLVGNLRFLVHINDFDSIALKENGQATLCDLPV